MSFEIPESTINAIYFQLGNAEDYLEGDFAEGTLMGQLLQRTEQSDYYKPCLIEYKAQVINKEDKKQWHIIKIRPQ